MQKSYTTSLSSSSQQPDKCTFYFIQIYSDLRSCLIKTKEKKQLKNNLLKIYCLDNLWWCRKRLRLTKRKKSKNRSNNFPIKIFWLRPLLVQVTYLTRPITHQLIYLVQRWKRMRTSKNKWTLLQIIKNCQQIIYNK